MDTILTSLFAYVYVCWDGIKWNRNEEEEKTDQSTWPAAATRYASNEIKKNNRRWNTLLSLSLINLVDVVRSWGKKRRLRWLILSVSNSRTTRAKKTILNKEIRIKSLWHEKRRKEEAYETFHLISRKNA